MIEVQYKGQTMYIYDNDVSDEEADYSSVLDDQNEDELDKTREIDFNIKDEDLLLDTVVDLWDDTDDSN